METLNEKSKTNIYELDNTPLDDYTDTTLQNTVSDSINDDIIQKRSNADFERTTKSASEATLKNIASLDSNKVIINTLCGENSFKNDSHVDVDDKSLYDQPRILYEAKNKKNTNKKNFKISTKCTRLVRIRNVNFKNKYQVRGINKKLESYYNKTKKNIYNLGQSQQSPSSDSILKEVSRTRILRKVYARENILEEIEFYQSNSNWPEVNKTSSKSETSKVTLKSDNSALSQNDDFNSTNNVKSVIEIEKTEDTDICYPEQLSSINTNNNNINTNPYNTGVINVVIAQLNNTSILGYNKKPTAVKIKSREQTLFQESLTSAESFMSQTETITPTSSLEMSKSNSRRDFLTSRDSNEISCITITPQQICESNSENDSFVIAKTSSYFKNTDVESDSTLKPEPPTDILKPKNNQFQDSFHHNYQDLKPALLDTIINIGMYPKLSENSTQHNYFENLNDVIITDEKFKLPSMKLENDYSSKFPKKGIKKLCNTENDGDRYNLINLPDENTIRKILTDTENSQKRSCAAEFRNLTPGLDLWEKLTEYLDTALKKMEESLVEKINQLKETLNSVSGIESNVHDVKAETKLVDVELQCCLVKNQIIDDLKVKLSIEGDKDLRKEIVKSPVSRMSNEITIGDQVAVSSSVGERIKPPKQMRHFLRFISRPMFFFKENMLVIVSVPIFCFALFLIYCFLGLVKNV